METRLPAVSNIPECADRLLTVDGLWIADSATIVADALRNDRVVLVKSVPPEAADDIMASVSETFDLLDDLKLQAAFASVHGHRRNVGKYFMSVNDRGDYGIIPPHSEGTSKIAMQLAAFFCYENSTDGGETILFRANQSSELWEGLRERATRCILRGAELTHAEAALTRGVYNLRVPDDLIRDEDEILLERASQVPALRIVDVLAKVNRTYSRILNRSLFSYWDSVSCTDKEAGEQYCQTLRELGLLKEPNPPMPVRQMDVAASRRVRSSGINHMNLFSDKITLKLERGDLILHNNASWAHSTTNWTPGSGDRVVAAAFA